MFRIDQNQLNNTDSVLQITSEYFRGRYPNRLPERSQHGENNVSILISFDEDLFKV